MEQNSPFHTMADWICAAEFYNQQIRSKRIYPSEVLSSSKQTAYLWPPPMYSNSTRIMKQENEREK